MSAGIIPDLFRHTARKSTVSKTIKSPTISSSCHNTSLSYVNSHFKPSSPIPPTTLFDDFQHQIKVENDVLLESLLLVPDNEIEQMIVDDDCEQIIEQILDDLCQVICSIPSSSPPPVHNGFLHEDEQIERRTSTDGQQINQLMSSILTQIDENEYIKVNRIDGDLNVSSDDIVPMESEQHLLTTSQSHIEEEHDDDIAEIQEISTNTTSNPPSCTCQCHLSNSSLNEEYSLFEQALTQIRIEQQNKSSHNNRLIQTLKRQHEELMSFYQQYKKTARPLTINRVDREQQTVKHHSNDCQIQTDLSTPVVTVKKAATTISTTSTVPMTATRIPSAVNNSTSRSRLPPTPSNAHLPTATRKTAVSSPSVPTPLTPITPSNSHDVVDLTEEDDDETSGVSTSRTSSIRQSTSSSHSSTSPSTATTSTATRIRPTNRSIRPNNPPTSSSTSSPSSSATQTFPLRPLPEHTPCDQTIGRPHLSITQENATVRLTWNLTATPMEAIQNYEIYAYKQNATVTNSDWKKIGTVKSMRLPMAVTLKEFQSNSHYAFAVRAVSTTNHIGPFCEPKTIFTGNNPVQPLHTSQLLNVST